MKKKYDPIENEQIEFLHESLDTYSYMNSSQLAHASNIFTKYAVSSDKQKRALEEVLPYYNEYLSKQNELIGYSTDIIEERVKLLNEYYNVFNDLELDKYFTSQSKFRSTILEEFMFLLFRDYIKELKDIYNDKLNLLQGGATKAYTNLYFTASGIDNFIRCPNMEINVKDQDFAIYRIVNLNIDKMKKEIRVPIVAVENKTYLDKTMLEGCIATAEKIKSGNPYTKFVVVTENYDVDLKVDPVYSRIDQIYVLRKSKRKEQFAPVDAKVVIRFFTETKAHIERPWSNIEEKMRKEGIIM